VWVIANVPEKDISYIHPSSNHNQPVSIVVSAYPQETFRGHITRTGDVLDPVTRTLRIRVEVSNQQRRLKPEMFAMVRVQSDPDPQALTIPSSAIQRDRDESIVFVQSAPQRFERRAVKLGEESSGMVKVLDGLREGEQVVTYGSFMLKSELVNQRHIGPGQ
jgi:cobalt-zinc-cadmium efflux system membrane fusion protein